MKPPKPEPTSTTSSPGLSRSLRATWSHLLRCASSSVRVLVPAVADPREGGAAAVDPGLHPGGERLGEAALDVDLIVEVGLEQADIAEGGHAPVGPRIAKHQ